MEEKQKEELKKNNPALYNVAMEGGTEAPFSGKYVKEAAAGMYTCAVCGNQLFKSDAKFESKGSGLAGWPSFDDAIPGSVEFRPDDSLGMHRTEVVCKNCGSHLGHLFDDPSEGKTGKHFCINSVCLNLQKEK